MMRVARRIAEVRVGLGLTQEAVAERLGISLKGVQRIEQGRQNLTLRTLVRVAQVLGVQVIALFEAPTAKQVRRGRPAKVTTAPARRRAPPR